MEIAWDRSFDCSNADLFQLYSSGLAATAASTAMVHSGIHSLWDCVSSCGAVYDKGAL
jgi:hypothetical protein